MAKPFLKWAGGKRGLLGELKRFVPQRFGDYYEPFLGGGALFFDLEQSEQIRNAAYLSDVNKELVTTYQAVRGDPETVIDIASQWPYEKELFMKIRAEAPETNAGIAARMIYLNRTCFNGLYRVNKSGEFNVPFGRYTDPKICDEKGLRECSVALKRAAILVQDFSRWEPSPGDFCYFDPPYIPASGTANFRSYTVDGFSEADQLRLRDYATKLASNGVHVVLSNSDTPWVREHYEHGFHIHSVAVKRNINSKGDRRGPVGEVIIVGRRP